MDVVYNSSNNELVRTQTLVKNAIIQIDATPFRQWYNQHYGVEVGLKKKIGAQNVAGDEAQVPRELLDLPECYLPCMHTSSSGLQLGMVILLWQPILHGHRCQQFGDLHCQTLRTISSAKTIASCTVAGTLQWSEYGPHLYIDSGKHCSSFKVSMANIACTLMRQIISSPHRLRRRRCLTVSRES